MDPDRPTAWPRRNPGLPFDAAWVAADRVSLPVAPGNSADLVPNAPSAPAVEAVRLVAAVGNLDLTSLAGDDSPEGVADLCARARQPFQTELLSAIQTVLAPGRDLKVAAVCVYPALVPTAVDALRGTGIAVAAVAGGFPAGQMPLALKRAEIEWLVAHGAEEIDAVIWRAPALANDWRAVYDEVRAFKRACGPAMLKVILATGELGKLERVARVSRACLLAGADFLKTSTGKEAVNASLPVGQVMAGAIADYAALTGIRAGLKPAGGLRRASEILAWQDLMERNLGPAWLSPNHFRIGASGLLDEVCRRLAVLVGGQEAPDGA